MDVAMHRSGLKSLILFATYSRELGEFGALCGLDYEEDLCRKSRRSLKFFRPRVVLDGKTPAEVAGIVVKCENKWLTMIQNASHDRDQEK
jgi:hypothetical protein